MRKLKLLSLLMLICFSVGNVWADDPAAQGTTLFSEDFSSYAANDVPSGSVGATTGRVIYGGGSVTYTCADNGTNKTMIYAANLATGTSPELLVGKSAGVFTIAGIPSGGAQEITVSFKQNAQKLTVSLSGTGYSTEYASPKPSAAGAVSFDITVADGADATFTLIMSAGSSNVRVDDILVTVKTAGEGGAPAPTLTSIAVSGTPTKTAYNTGDEFDPAGLTVTGTYSNSSTAPITSGITWAYNPSQTLAKDQTSIGVTATVGEISSDEFEVTGLTVTDPVVSNWQVIAPADLATGDVVVLTMLKNSVYYAAPNNGGNNAPAATAVAVAGDKLSDVPAETLQWTVTVVSEGVYQFSVGDNYLKCTDTNNGVKVGTGDYNTFDVVVENEKSYLHTTETMSSATDGRFLGIYNTQDWRCYSSVNNNIKDGSLVIFKDASAAPAVAKPTISGENNFFTSTTVTLACATDGAAIYYTINGSDPKEVGTVYSAPFSLSEGATVQAIAKVGEDWSDYASKTFTKGTVITVAQAFAAIDDAPAGIADQYVVGVISQIDNYNDTYHSITYWISADGSTEGQQLQVYSGLAGIVKDAFASVADLAVGDDVTVKGTLKKYGEVYEFDKNNTIVAYKPVARLAWAGTVEGEYDASLEGENTFPTLTNTNNVSVSYSSSESDYATIDPATGEITLVAEGSTIITASFAGNETYKANEASYTLNVASSVVKATISFDVDGGDAIDALTDRNALPSELPIATKAGKNFAGWFTDAEKTVEAVPGAAITEDITLHAKWLDPYTVVEALAIIEAMEDGDQTANSVYVSGIVSKAPTSNPNSGRLTFYISADGEAENELQAYNCKGLNNANFESKTDIQLLDEVTIYGPLKRYIKNEEVVPEFNTGYLYSFSRKADAGLEWSESSFDAYISAENTFPTLTNDNNVTVVYSSSEPNYATIDASTGVITLVAEGQTVIKATFAGDETYKAAEVSYTLHVHPAVVHASITYVENGANEDIADVEDAIALPDPLPTVTKDNYLFGGWFLDGEFNTPAVAGASLSDDVTLYAKWNDIPPYALVYTSNVEFVGGGASYEANSKVIINEVDEYAAQKVGASSKGGAITVTVPAKTHTLHFHVFTWKNASNTISVSGELTNLSASTIDVNGDDAGGASSPYTITSNPVGHYQFITFDPVAEPTEITFTSPTSGERRFIMYGINQEGGVLPVLDHIVITGEASELVYEIGDEFNPAGLGVNAIYTLEEVEQEPVAVDAADIEWSFDPAHIAAETSSVTVTATVGGKTDSKVVTGLTVNVPAPEILVDPASVAFGNVNQDAEVEAEVINVTLKSVANATIALTGDVAAFILDKAALTANGTISVTPVTSVAGTFAATITISDDANAADSKEVALSMTVKAPETPDVCDGEDDFATDESGDGGSYKARETTNGWSAVNTARKEIDEHMYWTINGKTTGVGVITSPVLNDGIATLKFRYANTFSESNGVSVKIEIMQGEDVVKEYTLTKASAEVTQNEVYTELIENINVAGDFQIVFTNLCPSENSSNNKDRVSIGRLCWTGYTAAPEPPVEDWVEVRTGLTEGNYYTICLPKKVTNFRGATIWNLEKRDTEGKVVYLEEAELPFAAGTPFIIQATADKLEVVYEGAETSIASTNGALVGTLTGLDVDAFAALSGNIYILKDNAIRPRTTGNWLSAQRAYIDYDELDPVASAPVPAPGRRVLRMPLQGQVATGIDALNASEAPVKMLIDGKMYILRGEKMYDATGRLVK